MSKGIGKPIHGAATIALVFALQGCGGSNIVRVDPVYADGTPIEIADYVGKTFPLLYLLGEDNAPSAIVEGGVAEITVVDVDTVLVDLPGRDPIQLTRVGDTDEFEGDTGDGRTISIIVDDNGEYLFAACECDGIEGFDYSSVFGFETPEDMRPDATVDYDGVYSGVILAADNDPEYLLIPGGGSGRLVANFDAGSIAGVLIDNGVDTALDDDDIVNDGVGAYLTMEGDITSKGFDGTVDGDIYVKLDGSDYFAVPTTITNSSVEGRFMGNSGETAAAVYEGDAALDFVDPEFEDIDATFKGIFVGTHTPDD